MVNKNSKIKMLSNKIPFIFFLIIIIIIILNLNINGIKCTVVKSSDDYVKTTQSECFTSKRIFSCFKYKAARYIWSMATGHMKLFDLENLKNTNNDNNRRNSRQQHKMTNNKFINSKTNQSEFISMVQLNEPTSTSSVDGADDLFPNAKQISGDNEFIKLWKFLQRSFNRFFIGHGMQMTINDESGVKVIEDNEITSGGGDDESRAKKKKQKWQILFPIAILIKLMHLKWLVAIGIIGVGALQFITVAGGIALFHYLKYNTLCKFQPHLIHSHSHHTDDDHDLGYASYHNGYSSGGVAVVPAGSANAAVSPTAYIHNHHTGGGSYKQDWISKRAYNAYDI